MVHGECEWDAWFLDPRRFTGYANTEHTALKAIEDYQREFHYHLPHEQRPAGRLARTTPLYPVLDRLHCEWGTINGWERTLFLKPNPDFVDEHGYRFTPTEDVVAAEVTAVRDRVGLMEVSGFNRYEIAGPGAEAFLDRMVCGAIPRTVGKVNLCYLLTERGSVLSEATLARLGDERFWYGSAAAAEWHDRDWLLRHMPMAGVTLTELTSTHTILVVAGPESRALLQSVSPRCDWSEESFPWLRARPMFVGHAEVLAMSVSFSGELAWELHVPNEQLYLTWKTLDDAGQNFGLRHFGLYATESMRLEKGYRHWKADLIYEYDPMESGLERFVKLDKGDFVGREALLARIAAGPRRRFVTLTVDCDIAPAHGGDPVYSGEEQVGSVTSGGFGHRISRNIAFAFVAPDVAEEGTELRVGILGESYAAVVTPPCLYDPQNSRIRSPANTS